MTLRRCINFLLVLSVLAVAAPTSAELIFLEATLTNANETPPVSPTIDGTSTPRASSGTASFVLNTTSGNLFMTMTANVVGIDIDGTQTSILNDNLTAAHIHAGPLTPAGTRGVRWGFFGAPDNDTNPKQLVITPAASGAGGTFTSIWDAPEGNGGTDLEDSLPVILASQAYINFHTTQFPGGEIRGNLVVVRVVPAPATLALLGLGLVGLAGGLRRRAG